MLISAEAQDGEQGKVQVRGAVWLRQHTALPQASMGELRLAHHIGESQSPSNRQDGREGCDEPYESLGTKNLLTPLGGKVLLENCPTL